MILVNVGPDCALNPDHIQSVYILQNGTTWKLCVKTKSDIDFLASYATEQEAREELKKLVNVINAAHYQK